jgi:hypothetical protein
MRAKQADAGKTQKEPHSAPSWTFCTLGLALSSDHRLKGSLCVFRWWLESPASEASWGRGDKSLAPPISSENPPRIFRIFNGRFTLQRSDLAVFVGKNRQTSGSPPCRVPESLPTHTHTHTIYIQVEESSKTQEKTIRLSVFVGMVPGH